MHICYYNGLRKHKVGHRNSGLWTPNTGLNPELSHLVCVAGFHLLKQDDICVYIFVCEVGGGGGY